MVIEEKIARLMTKEKKTLAVAESCTGGLLANRLTNIPGSSNFFKAGLIVYSNEAKNKFLKIPSRIFLRYGAVSPQVARLMAQRVREVLKTDFGIGITGIAGPTGGSLKKPVGCVFVALNSKDKKICMKYLFRGSRRRIKSQATTKALQLLLRFLA